MVAVGQQVNTKYGAGVVITAMATGPEVFVRMNSNSRIYVLNTSEVVAIEAADRVTEGVLKVLDRAETAVDDGGALQAHAAAGMTSRPNVPWRGQMKKRRPHFETP